MAAESAVSTGRKVLAEILVRGAAQILTAQLPTGEIPTYRLSPEGNLQYCRSPFISTFVYDALGYFDPFSPRGDIQTREMIPDPLRSWFGAAVGNIRRGIRRFVAWQQEPGAVWRFFGSGSGIDPDSDTTACAATLLLESPPYNLRDDWRKHLDVQVCRGDIFFLRHARRAWLQLDGQPGPPHNRFRPRGQCQRAALPCLRRRASRASDYVSRTRSAKRRLRARLAGLSQPALLFLYGGEGLAAGAFAGARGVSLGTCPAHC
jgi:hypothetical protein